MQAVPVLMNAGSRGALDNNVYGLFLNPVPKIEPAGSLSIGQVETSRYTGKVVVLPVTKNV